MAYQKLQPTQALEVILSDTVNPIDPSRSNLSGTTVAPLVTNKLTDFSHLTKLRTGSQDDAPVAFQLFSGTGAFLDSPAVAIGDLVRNTTDGTYALVTVVVSQQDLTLDTDIMNSLSDGFEIYQGTGFVGKVSIGDLVLNESANTLTAVTAVASYQLTFATDAFPSSGVGYRAYGNVSQMNSGTVPFVAYVGDSTGAAATWSEVKVTTAAGNDVVFSHFPTGTFLPVQCLRVWSTGTTATNVIALW
tara:strand:- start:319 stop:1056 length:738 start_codon:yes stop_codon:yes gene_type:complete